VVDGWVWTEVESDVEVDVATGMRFGFVFCRELDASLYMPLPPLRPASMLPPPRLGWLELQDEKHVVRLSDPLCAPKTVSRSAAVSKTDLEGSPGSWDVMSRCSSV